VRQGDVHFRSIFHTVPISSFEDQHHDRVPFERLTQAHPCVDCFALYREGLFAPGASARLETPRGGYQIASHEAGKILIDGQPVRVGWHPALPQRVFICEACGQTRYKLFHVGGRWACARCQRLTHASRHHHRMLVGWHRLMLLRHKIGASPVPYTSITPKPLRQRRYWRIVLEIRQIEARLVGHIREDVSDVLERRDGRRS
jgi:hypothetical protein